MEEVRDRATGDLLCFYDRGTGEVRSREGSRLVAVYRSHLAALEVRQFGRTTTIPLDVFEGSTTDLTTDRQALIV